MKPLRYDDVHGIGRFDQGFFWDSMVSSTGKDNHKMRKAKVEAKKQDDNAFPVFCTGVETALTTNAATFPALAGATAQLTTTLATYKTDLQAVVDARTALQTAIAAKNNSREAVEAVLRVIAPGVDAVALGDVEIIHLAGLQASNEPSASVPSQVQNLVVVASDKEGELHASWNPDPDAVFFRVQVSLDTTTVPTNWVNKLETTQSSCSLNHDLVPGTKVWTRVQAVGPGVGNEGAWSDVAWKRVP